MTAPSEGAKTVLLPARKTCRAPATSSPFTTRVAAANRSAFIARVCWSDLTTRGRHTPHLFRLYSEPLRFIIPNMPARILYRRCFFFAFVTLSLTLDALAQGTLDFKNISIVSGSRVVDAPVYAEDGVTGLLGTGFRAALYAGTPGTPINQLRSIGSSVSFLTATAGAGYFIGGTRTLNENGVNIVPGGPATLQVRVWRLADGLTWEDAVAAGRGYTSSDPLNMVSTGGAGSPPGPPALMIGLRFSAPLVPEPSSFSFAGVFLGAVAAGYFLKRGRGQRKIMRTYKL